MNDDLELLAGRKPTQLDFNIDRWPGVMLKALRGNLGFTPEYAAKQLEISVSRLHRYEANETIMPSEVIAKAADFFQVLPSAFFKRVDWADFSVDEVLNRIADDYHFELMLCQLTRDERRQLEEIASVIFPHTGSK